MVAAWGVFYIEDKRFDLDTLRVSTRSPTPISKSNDFLGQSDDIWGGPGPPFPADFGFRGVRAGQKHVFVALWNGHHVVYGAGPLARPISGHSAADFALEFFEHIGFPSQAFD